MQFSLYASLHFQIYGILTVMTPESAMVNNLVHMSFLQLNDIEPVTSQLVCLIKLQASLTCVIIRTHGLLP